MATLQGLDFQGTERFEIRRRIGAGGMGVVYEAYDREREAVVALKTLMTVDAGSIYRLKKEFRSLTDTSHPNLVTLHELISVGDRWFFTMDLIDGVDFLTWVRQGSHPRAAATLEMTPPSSGASLMGATSDRLPGTFDEAALRAALVQLARAVSALHAAGKLHRDLKPSNVMVAADGQVTVLDFGLVSDEIADGIDLYKSIDDRVMGTPAYMAPEQAAGRPASAASDWYAVGAMLYEVLTGVLPFAGSVVHVLAMKQVREPPPPQDLARDLPGDLAALAVELLRTDPAARPSGDEVLRRLSGGARKEARAPSPAPHDAPALVGRDAQLAILASALGEARAGGPVTVGVYGASGLGKTALVQHFLDRLRAEGSTVVLAGRCYERETVPFKALDSAIDALSRYLRRLPPDEIAALLPRDIHALARLFPVLRRVRAIETAPQPAGPIADAQELRRRAFAACKELLARIADRRPLVVFVDDLQWGDADSAALVSEILRAPDAPAALCVGAWRSEHDESPLITGITQARDAVTNHRIQLDRLSEDDARSLAALHLAQAGVEDEGLAAAIAAESEGNPFFCGELARHVLEQRSALEAPRVRLTDVIRERVERLPRGARSLLETIAVAGGPVETTVAVRAAKLDRDAPAALVALRAGSLVRSHGVRREEVLETYHDRIRETVCEGLTPDRSRSVHRRLARALMVTRDPDPEALAIHLEGAGEREEAGTFAKDAAAQAAEALAFDRAIRLYQRALSLRPDDTPDRWQIQEALADALANEGRSAEAADAYLAAAESAGEAGLDLRRRASEHLLRSGHVGRGLAIAEAMLAEVGMQIPKTPRAALASIVYHRSIQAVRGIRFRERTEREVPVDELRRTDVTWSMAIGFSMLDPIRGAEFQARHLKHALRAGEPYRVARALALEAAHVASTGKHDRALDLLDRVERIGRRLDHPHVLGLVAAMRGTCAFFRGEWEEGLGHTREGEAILADRCTNVAWERATNMRFELVSLYYLGRLGELSERVPGLVEIARDRDDLYARACAGSGCAIAAWLAADDLAAADAHLDELEGHLANSEGFKLQHYMLLQGRTHTDLYRGRGREAWERVQRQWPAIERSLLLRVPMLRTIMLAERAASALAAGAPDDAAEAAKRLEAESLPWAAAMATLARAGIAHQRGDTAGAHALLERAAAELDAQGARLFAAAARLHCGDPGADRAFRDERVKDPEAMARSLVAGFSERT